MFHTMATYAIYVTTAVFLLGMAGSAVVVMISFVEDFSELFSNDEVEAIHTNPPAS